ncbi:MAG: T9SS type A sorting domain-containing protein [Cytophagales bacterium]
MEKNKLNFLGSDKLFFNNVITKFFFKTLIFMITMNEILAQKELVISGGNTVSSLVCANRNVFVWGNNTGGQLGITGGNIISSPTALPETYFNGLDIQQVNSGSGNHFVALDCNGGVWSWGQNTLGQVGNGTSGGVVKTPVQVLVPTALKSNTKYSSDGVHLTGGVDVVYAGNNNSFAILDDGRLISWGSNGAGSTAYDNAFGQLGQGAVGSGTSIVSTPNFVIIPNGQPLQPVSQVFAGDNSAYALVNGTVYSWGHGQNGTLGRNAAGNANPASYYTEIDGYARPVLKADNSILNNITAISAGDVFGIALDTDGYVWTWGHGGWNNATGNTTINYIGSDPRKVLKGTTTGASNDGTYLLAKAIGGGQGFGMAVTVDGKPVAWGGTGTCADGGMTGTGTTTAGIPPTYIQYGTNLVHNNVTLINRGDTWGFYGTSNNEFYAWGCNTYGQLGIGNTTDQTRAVKITPPTGCGFRDPFPTVKLTPSDTSVCQVDFEPAGVLLKSNFVPSSSLDKAYQITWYKDGVLVKGNPNSTMTTEAGVSVNGTYQATKNGKYKVVMKYLGANGGCVEYPIAADSITITYFPKTFDVPTDLTYCADTATVNVTSSLATNPIYTWYASATSDSQVLGTTLGNSKGKILLKNIADTAKGIINVYVEEKNYASGNINLSDCGNPKYNSIDSTKYQTRYTAYEPIVINELSVNLRVSMSKIGKETMNLKLGVFPALDYTYYILPNNSSPLSIITVPISFSRTLASDPTTQILSLKIPVEISIPGVENGYVFFLSVLESTPPVGVKVEIAASQCKNFPFSDNISTKDILTQTGISLNYDSDLIGTNLLGGYFYGISFKGVQKYCERKLVKIPEKCICYKPKSVEISSSFETLNKVITVPTGSQVSLKGTYSLWSGDYTDMKYFWYKNGKKLLTDSLFSAKNPFETTSINLTSNSDSGTYILRVFDKKSNTSNCYLEDYTKVRFGSVTNLNDIDIVNQLNVYPNPFEDFLKVELSDKISDVKMMIENIQGQVILEKTLTNETYFEWNTKHLKSGIYFVKILLNDKIQTYKLSK